MTNKKGVNYLKYLIILSTLFLIVLTIIGRKTILIEIDNKCIMTEGKKSDKNDVVLLSVADEGRVDLKSIIYPIDLLRRNSDCTIILFVEKKIHEKQLNFFNSLETTFSLNIVPFEKPNIYIANYRIKLYLDYLKNHKFNRVIHCDVSDIYFQSDPFQYIPTNGKLLVFKEGCEGNILMDDPKNLQWYEECYPELKGLDKTKEIINAGIISGGYSNLLSYVEIIWKLMEENKNCDISKFGPDQAVVEYAYHNGLLKNLIGKIEKGPVYCKKHHIDYGIIKDENNCILPFIHGRPPYYPEKLISFGLEQQSKLLKLID